MTLDLARLEALAAAATPGPWRLAEVTEADTELGTYPAEKGAPLPVEHLDLYRAVRDMEPVAGAHHPERGVNVFSLGAERQENIACLVHVNPDDPNAAFIAACDPTTVQALCARIRALEAVAQAAMKAAFVSAYMDSESRILGA